MKLSYLSSPFEFIGQTFPANGGTVTILNYFPVADKYLVRHHCANDYRYSMNGPTCRILILKGLEIETPAPVKNEKLETAKQNIGGFFWLKNNRCQVTKADSFSGTVHYGFVTVDKPTGNNIAGWIPAEIIGGTELTA